MTTLKCLSGLGMYINTIGHVMNFMANMANADDNRGRSVMYDRKYESWYDATSSVLRGIVKSLNEVKNKKDPRPEEKENKHDDGPTHLIFSRQED